MWEIHFYRSRKVYLVMILKSPAATFSAFLYQKSVEHAIPKIRCNYCTVCQKPKNAEKPGIFLKVYLFILREREGACACEWGKDRQRESQRESNSTESDSGLDPMNCEIMT